ncbi:MAG: hypothetical protein VB934_16860 [Polyangiaceae bacterium]
MIRRNHVIALAASCLLACGAETASSPTSGATASGGGGQTSSSTGAGGDSTASIGSAGGGGSTSSANATTGPSGGGGSEPCTPSTGTEPVGSASVRDNATCLVWQTTEGSPLNNINGAKHCADLAQDGFDDWRLPGPEEMATWPMLTSSANAYVTAPTYIAKNAVSDEMGCKANAHSCNLAKYSMQGMSTCAWQGVGYQGPLVCVRGASAEGSLPTMLMATQCSICASHVTGATADFKEADCLPFAD